MTYYSRKRAAEIDQEILNSGIPDRTDGFDDAFMPLAEDLAIQMKAIADKKKNSLGPNHSKEARESRREELAKYRPEPKKKTPRPAYSEVKKALLDQITKGGDDFLGGVKPKPKPKPKASPAPAPAKAKLSEVKNLDFSGVEDNFPDFDENDDSIAGMGSESPLPEPGTPEREERERQAMRRLEEERQRGD